MMVFSTRRVVSATGGNYDYKLGINPVVVLWNPYNVTLQSPAVWIQITPGALEYKAYVNDSVKVEWTQLRRQSGPLELNLYAMEGKGLNNSPILLRPGETRIHSAVSGFINAADFRHAEIYPGYQPPDAGGGFEVDLQGLTGLPANAESINGRFKSGGDFIGEAGVSAWNLPFARAATGSRFAGIPGYLTQADLLKRIGNMITPRDDTFRIRGYGEARDAHGNIQARCWCEAVVQRTPAYLDAVDSAETATASLTSDANRKFGRSFLVTSFRWLSPDKI